MANHNGKLSHLHTAARQLLYDEMRLLFQRVNFFLAGTAFLITAYAVVVASEGFRPDGVNSYLIVLAHAINAVGFSVAVGFALISFANAKIISGLYIHALDLEARAEADEAGKEAPTAPLARYREIDDSLAESGFLGLVVEIPRELVRFAQGPLDFSRRTLAPHTWMVPLFLSLFWLVVWYGVMWPWWFVPTGFLLGLPVIYLAIRWTQRATERRRKPR